MKNKLIKTLTLFCFIGLIVIFIVYRSDKTEPIIQSSPNTDSTNNLYNQNLLIKQDSFEINEMMSSSKSIILPRKTKVEDTLPTQTIDLLPDSVMEQQRMLIMSSSKSAIIFDKSFPTINKLFLNDSLKKIYNPESKIK